MNYDELVARVCEILPAKYARFNFEEHTSPVFSLDGSSSYYYRYRVVDSNNNEYYREYGGMDWLSETIRECNECGDVSLIAHLFVYAFVREYGMFFPRFGQQLLGYRKEAEKEIRERGYRWHNRGCSRFIVYPEVDYEVFMQMSPDSDDFARAIVRTMDDAISKAVIEKWVIEGKECV